MVVQYTQALAGFRIEDGKAFIGKDGKGRIEFDGDTGVIKSSSWVLEKENESSKEQEQRGMKIDLDNGILDIQEYYSKESDEG